MASTADLNTTDHRLSSFLAFTEDGARGGPGLLIKVPRGVGGANTWLALSSGGPFALSKTFKNHRELVTVGFQFNGATAPLAATGANFFTADGKSYAVSTIEAAWTVPESTAVTANLKVERCQGTEAAAAGDDLLAVTNLSVKGTANTVNVGTVLVAAGINVLAAGDRLVVHTALDNATAGITTELVGSVTVKLKGVADGIEPAQEGELFVATGRTYKLVNVEAVWQAAEVTASQCNLIIERLQTTEKPGATAGGAGDRLVGLTDIPVTGTVSTVKAGVVVTAAGVDVLAIGDRLSINFVNNAGTTTVVPTELDGLQVTLTLVPTALDASATS